MINSLKTHLLSYKSIYVLSSLFVLLLIGLDGGRPFATPDEGRYVEIPREMVETGDYITPRLNAMKYFEKPPLFYWMQAFVLKYFGMKEGVMRINVMMCSFLTILMIFSFARRFLNLSTALWASIILTTSGLYYALSRLIILDMVLTTCITGAFISFYRAFYARGFERRLWFYAFTIFCGLGVLTKGIVTLALVGPATIFWLILTKQFKQLFPLYLPTTTLLFFAITVPWHVLAHINNADFLHKYFYVEHFLRYITTIHLRYQPVWFFIPVLLGSVTPWLTTILEGFVSFEKDKKELFYYIAIWSGWTFSFYSFGNSKLVPYILPCIPPLAIMGGYGAYTWSQNKEHFSLSKIGIFILFVIGLISLALPSFAKGLFVGCEETIPYIYLASVMFLGSIFFIYIIKSPAFSLYFHLFYAMVLIVLANSIAPFIQKTSVKPLAEWIVLNKKNGDYIVSFQNYYQDLPLYTKTTPIVCVDDFNELVFGMEAELIKTKEWMLTSQEFVEKFKPGSKKNFWLIVTQKRFPKLKELLPNWHLKVAAQYKELILIYHQG
jgi:4-amino-4-deoxy-L-arabinose transferase-like glycosyltransferase